VKEKKHIAILGSTGSIGRSTLEVVARFPDRFHVAYLTAHRNITLLRDQIDRFHPRAVVVADATIAQELRDGLDSGTRVLFGSEGLEDIVTRADVDLVLSSLVGFAGLKPTLWAVEAGKDVALANKESLVVAGELIMKGIRKYRGRLLPVDSEHSAILQCLQGEDLGSVERLILTASGGPFLNLAHDRFPSVTVEQALNHPTWRMGNKITIDSATLMNKGLEVIEAYWLFGLPPDKIEVVIHPQSIIHSLVEFVDGSMKAQMGIPDMKLPIQYALLFPERPASPYQRIDLPSLGEMTFQRPDEKRFPCLPLAYRALRKGGTAPAVLNAANEVAVRLFLDGRISFPSIPAIIEETLEAHVPQHPLTLEGVERADREAREQVRQQFAAVE
jgi:1-deoxy-D-xylulose-5-phosphate reductoisomerase